MKIVFRLALTVILLMSSEVLLAQRGRGRSLGPRIEPQDLKSDVGTDAIPDRATFDKFSYKGFDVGRDGYLANLQFVKFCIDKANPDDPKIYFMNTANYRAHPPWMQMVGISTRERGAITYLPRLTNPSGKPGLYIVDFEPRDSYSFEEIDGFLRLLTKHMPLLKGRVAFHPLQGNVARYERDKEKYKAAGVTVHLDSDLFKNISFLPLNSAEGFGQLRLMQGNARPTSRDVVIYKTLPNQMPRVAGVMTEVRQTPLSHVNLRAIQDRIPNAFIRNASKIDEIKSLIGKLVHFKVTPQGYEIRPATKVEVDKHLENLRPLKSQIPVRNLNSKEIKQLSEIAFAQSDSFGVKTANLATLRSITMPVGVPDGYGVPFYFYDEFMKHNGFYKFVKQMFALPEFGDKPDRDLQMERLRHLRLRIETGKVPDWMLKALANVQRFPKETSLRCRSSTNNEDLLGFSGAGLYDSYTHKPNEGHLAKSIKQVYASLWNFRAFEEREFYRIDHYSTAMGVLLHPNFKGEKANGVAVTDDILYETSGNYYLNTQVGEDLVTNPNQTSSTEEILLGWYKEDGRQIVRRSSDVSNDKLLLSESHLSDLRESLARIHSHFAKLYNKSKNDARFAMEIEFKITKDGKLVIKQARPWVFNTAQ